jgi:hypothetical protein
MVVLGGMILLLLAGAPREAGRASWITALGDPMTLRLMGAVVIGVGVYWGLVIQHHTRKRRRR